MEHLITVLETESAGPSIAEAARLLDERAHYVERLRARGCYVDGGRFRPSAEGVRVRGAGARARIEHGPFGGEVLAAYHFVRTAGLDEATEIARALPRGPADAVEIRPPMKANMQPGKQSLPGKVLGFAVLGAAATEDGWGSLMDRIDAETSEGFPDADFLGGMRLRAPTTGRRLAPTRDGALVLDGPFMESKEMIGGIFFLRLPGLDEAVAWAKQTPFVQHGALEIRELWRE